LKILVVDDHPLILEALRHTLTQLDQQVALFDARTAPDGRALVEAHPDADLLLLDLGLPGADGFALLDEIRAAHPGVPVVVLSGSDRREDVMRAIDAGAMGFIPKTSPSQVMLSALRLVLSGGVYVPALAIGAGGADGGRQPVQQQQQAQSHTTAARPGAEPPRARPTARDIGLTDRQAQVLALLLQGKPNKLICRELDLAEGTVKIHVAAILRALGVNTRTQAVIEVSRLGLALEDLVPRREERR
jgi:DNA-binding NarL/FixJ family response regulator